MQIVFMGTPDFAVPTLDALLASTHRVVAVYTRPDKPAGRSGTPVPSPVKRRAEAAGVPIEQPRTLRTPEGAETLERYQPDALVIAAYGLILPRAALDVPRAGAVNVHPSLLPRHRGASPVAGAILAGDKVTGVSIMLVTEGVDAGPLLAQIECPIEPDDTTGTLSDRLARVGAALLVRTLDQWAAGQCQPEPQDDRLATYTRRLEKQDGRLQWVVPAVVLARQVRAFQPWPGAFTTWNGRILKILLAAPVDWSGMPLGDEPGPSPASPDAVEDAPGPPHARPGLVLPKAPEGAATPVAVVTGRGLLAVREVQLEGRRPAAADEFVRGHRTFLGSQLGQSEMERNEE